MSQVVVTQHPQPQYAVRKRKKPQPRKPASENPIKSNPSKRHRDRLNTELERLAQLIPLPTDVVNKLDKLSILRLSVAYLRNKSYSKFTEHEDGNTDINSLAPASQYSQALAGTNATESNLFLEALDGFIMVVTQDFNVFYITSNVQECLGFPQSDIMNQSMLDLIHAEDRERFMRQMQIDQQGPVPPPAEEGDPPAIPEYIKHGITPEAFKDLSRDGLLHRSFICRLRCLHDTSSGFLALHFSGHLRIVPGQNRHNENGTQLPPELGLFVLASPLQTPSILEIRTKNFIFRTKHKLDYTPLGIDQKGRMVLGYTEQELRQQSGYQFIHSADMMHCADAHTKLMRQGESGLTVFRLLHRANRWLWVTASARLVFSKGKPEHIISTHRPITDQEGEEHLKKRSNAFRFDFTGQATLYKSINPIGAGPPPPSNNQSSYSSSPEMKPTITMNGPSTKRARITNGIRQHVNEFDPATLFGAQSLQSMENYKEGLPLILDNRPDYVSPGVNVPLGPDVKSEPNTSLKFLEEEITNGFKGQHMPQQTEYSPLSNKQYMMNGNSPHGTDSGYSDPGEYSASPVYSSGIGSVGESEPPPLHHSPLIQNSTAEPQYILDQFENYPINTQPQALPNNYSNGEPMQSWAGQPQNNQACNDMGQYPQPGKQPVGPEYHRISNANLYNAPEPPKAPIYDFQTQAQQHSQQFQQLYEGQGYSSDNRVMIEPYQGITTSMPRENPSVLNSLEISSTITSASEEQQRAFEDILGDQRKNSMLVKDEQNEIYLQYQENKIQFDLDRIAADYQTVNPMEVVKQYMQRNPSAAVAIATGSMPEGNMVQMPNGPMIEQTENFPSCRFSNGNVKNENYSGKSSLLTAQGPRANEIGQGNPEEAEAAFDIPLDEFINFNIPNI